MLKFATIVFSSRLFLQSIYRFCLGLVGGGHPVGAAGGLKVYFTWAVLDYFTPADGVYSAKFIIIIFFLLLVK